MHTLFQYEVSVDLNIFYRSVQIYIKTDTEKGNWKKPLKIDGSAIILRSSVSWMLDITWLTNIFLPSSIIDLVSVALIASQQQK